MDEQKFLEWYFGGDEDDQRDIIKHLGEWVKDSILRYGKCKITTDDLISLSKEVYLNELNKHK
jgi:hypothetical protein